MQARSLILDGRYLHNAKIVLLWYAELPGNRGLHRFGRRHLWRRRIKTDTELIVGYDIGWINVTSHKPILQHYRRFLTTFLALLWLQAERPTQPAFLRRAWLHKRVFTTYRPKCVKQIHTYSIIQGLSNVYIM